MTCSSSFFPSEMVRAVADGEPPGGEEKGALFVLYILIQRSEATLGAGIHLR